jgi:hypothetical protein
MNHHSQRDYLVSDHILMPQAPNRILSGPVPIQVPVITTLITRRVRPKSNLLTILLAAPLPTPRSPGLSEFDGWATARSIGGLAPPSQKAGPTQL